MAELKPEVQKNVGASVKQVTGIAPDIVALSARIIPTRVTPSAISAGVDPATNALLRLSASVQANKVTAEGDVLGAFAQVEQFARAGVDWLDANPDVATQDLYISQVRSKMTTQAIAVAQDLKLNNKEFGQLMTQVKGLMADTYHTELYRTKQGPGGQIVTTKSGKIVQSQFDAEVWLQQLNLQIQEQFPTQFGVLMAHAQGLEPNGQPIEGTPDVVRRKKDRANFIIESKLLGLSGMENANFELSQVKAAHEAVLTTNDTEQALAERAQASFRSNFNKLGMVQLYEVMTRDDNAALQGPPEAAMANFRAGLMNLRNSPEFVEFESHLRDPALFDKEVESLMKTAELAFSGKNMNIIKEFDVKTQDLVMKYIANSTLLAQGPQAVATMMNSESLARTIQAAISLNSFRGIAGASDTTLGATVLGIASGKGVDDMTIRLLHMNAERDVVRNTQRVGETLEDLRRQTNSLLDHIETGQGMQVTPHAIIEEINLIKSNPAFSRYLLSNQIPIKDRQMVLDMVDAIEAQVVRVSTLTPEDVQETRKRKVKIHKLWVNGLPEEAQKTGE